MTNTSEIQTKIKDLLNEKLIGEEVSAEKEWDVAHNSQDDYNRQIHYAPRVDIAVRPFMINYLTNPEFARLRSAFIANKELIEKIIETGESFTNFEYNRNPRCLIAIEIETSGTRKHLIGDITNASILGRVGIIVPTNEKNYDAFKRIMNYLEFAQVNGKMSGNVFRNIVLIKADDLINLLEAEDETG